MDFTFDADDILIGETTRQVLSRELPMDRLRTRIERGEPFDPALWQALAAAGLFGATLDSSWGGADLGTIQVATAIRECGAALAPVPVVETLALSRVVQRAGSPSLKAAVLPDIAAGNVVASASLAPARSLSAVRDGRRIRLTGEIRGVPFGDVAELVLAPVSFAEDGTRALVVCHRDWPAVEVVTSDYNGDLACPLSRWILRGTPVELDWILPCDRNGAMNIALCTARVGYALLAVGGCQATIAETVQYIERREQFGRAIATFQAVKHHAADMRIKLDMSEPTAYYAAWCGDHAPESALLASEIAYLAAADAYLDVVKIALQLHGALGYTWEHQTHLYLRAAERIAATFGSLRLGYAAVGRGARAAPSSTTAAS